MTVDMVKAAVANIEANKADPEVAHTLEDDLYLMVLMAIADGVDNAQELATEALKASCIEFMRWHA